MHPCQGPRNIQAVAWGSSLRLDANGPHARRQLGKIIGDLHKLVVQLLIINALKNLVVPVQAAVETVVGASPQPLTELQIVLPSLADGPKETHERTQRY